MAANLAPTFKIGTGKALTDIGGLEYTIGNTSTIQPDGSILVFLTGPGPNRDLILARYTANGTLDTSFGVGGKLTIDYGAVDNYAYNVRVQTDGKILISGAAGAVGDSFLMRYNSDGTSDNTFNGNGVVTIPTGFIEPNVAWGGMVTIQSDGKLLVTGNVLTPGGSLTGLVRFNSNGSIDNTFGNSGKVLSDLFPSIDEYISNAVIQTDGKIVVTGYLYLGPLQTIFALARYNSDGSLDASFGSGGKVSTDFNGADMMGLGVALQSDGKILMSGTSNVNGTYDFVLVRYNTNGTLDTSFDGDGKLITPFGTSEDFGREVLLQVDGKIIVAGYSRNANLDYEFALVRYNTNGTLDTSFNGNGKVTTNLSSFYDVLYSAELQSDGKILVTGKAGTGFGDLNYNVVLVRYNSDGSLDTNFNPTIDTLNNTPSYTENAALLVLDSTIQIYDAELSTLNGGIGNYSGASVTLARQSGANAQDVFSGSGTLSFSGANVVLSGVTIGTLTNTNGTLAINFNANATQVRVNQALSAISYANNSDAPPTSVQINWAFNDGNTGSQGTGGAQTTVGSTTVNIQAINDAPTFSTSLNNSPTYIENASPIILDNTISIYDAELAAIGSYDGASLSLERDIEANYQDIFSASGNLSFNNGSAILSGVTIGSVAHSPDGRFFIAFNSNATQARVNEALSSITYANSSNAPPASVQINWTFNDGNIGAQGTGSALSATGSIIVNITAVNDAPILINPLLNQNTTIGNVFSYAVASNSFTDIDGDTLSYSATLTNGNSLPSWLSFDAATRTFSGTPSETGAISVRVLASDPSLATVFDDFNLNIINNNSGGNVAPIVNSPIPNTNAVTGNFFNYALPANTFFDANGDQLSYNATLSNGNPLPAWLTFNGLTGTFSGRPTVNGNLDIRITASDPSLASASDTFTLNITSSQIPQGTNMNIQFNNWQAINLSSFNAALSTSVAAHDSLFQQSDVVSLTLIYSTSNTTASGTDFFGRNFVFIGNNYEDDTPFLRYTSLEYSNAFNTFRYSSPSPGVTVNIYTGAVSGAFNRLEFTEGDLSYQFLGTFGVAVDFGTELPILTGGTATSFTHNSNGNVLNVTGNLAIGADGNILSGTVTSFSFTDSTGNRLAIPNISMTWADFDSLTDPATHANLNDFYNFVASATRLAGNDVIVADATDTANDNINGFAGNDTLNGGGGNDTLIGGTGADTLDGGSGTDTLTGGDGNDLYILDNAGDVVIEPSLLAAGGIDTVQSSVSYNATATNNGANGAGIENITLTGANEINATGNALNNIITGNSVRNILDGGAGVDTLKGGDGNDVYNVDVIKSGVTAIMQDVVTEDLNKGLDAVSLRTTTDLGLAAAATLILQANVEDFSAEGTGSNKFNLTGNTLNNDITGNAADNIIDGGLGVDYMRGLAGNDTYLVDNIGDTVDETAAGSAGIDLVKVAIAAANGTFTLANGVDNATLTNAVAYNLTGNDLDNTLIGNAAANIINGGAGADVMQGGAGNDVYTVDNANDIVTELINGGTDTVNSNVAFSLLDTDGTGINGGNVENLTLIGTDNIDGTGNGLNNILTGNAGYNTLTAGAGNDILDGGIFTTSSDTLNGGDGNDTYIIDDLTDIIIDNAGTDTIQSSVTTSLDPYQTIENLTLTGINNINGFGNAAANVITGNIGDNVLTGDAIFDTIVDIDTLKGGKGNDTYFVNLTQVGASNATATVKLEDIVTENINEGRDNITLVGDFSALTKVSTIVLGANIEDLYLNSSSANTTKLNATGNTLDNLIAGNDTDNLLNGDAGNDVLIGGNGIDTLVGGAGNDDLVGGFGAGALDSSVDILQGGAGNDRYFVGLALNGAGDAVVIEDVITEAAGAGTDEVWLYGTQNLINATTLTLGANLENLDAGNAGDTKLNITGNILNNQIIGNNLANIIDGGTGNDLIYGGAGDDSIIGGIGDDNLNGNEDNDTLQGGAGNDILDGDTGADSLIGGAGNDTYFLDDANDLIEDIIVEDNTVGSGIDTVKTIFTYALANNSNLENLTLIGDDAVNATGNELNNTITGNANSNILSGGLGNDTLNGDLGNDTLIGGAGVDKLTGGKGNDTYNIDLVRTNALATSTIALQDTVNELANPLNSIVEGDSDTIILTNLTGNAGAPADFSNITNATTLIVNANIENFDASQTGNIKLNITGNTLANTITGNDADNILLDSTGNDTLNGGVGNDTLDGGIGVDTLVGGIGNDTYLVDIIATTTGAAPAPIVVTGAALQDTIVEINDTTDGIDTLKLRGSVTIPAATAATNITLAGALANIENLDVSLTGTTRLNLTGNDANNTLIGNAAVNTLTGGDGDDTLNGGAGLDILIGGVGNDTYVVDSLAEANAIVDGDGDNTINIGLAYMLTNTSQFTNITLSGSGAISATGNDSGNELTGNAAANILNGGLGEDRLIGGAGADTLNGGADNDTLIGGIGNDVLTGGLGVDTFVWSLADKGTNGLPSIDKITDFNFNSTEDKLDLRDLLVGENSSNISNYLDITTSTAAGVTSTEIRISNTGGFASGSYSAAAENQHITLVGFNLLDGTTESALLTSLINNKLIIDI